MGGRPQFKLAGKLPMRWWSGHVRVVRAAFQTTPDLRAWPVVHSPRTSPEDNQGGTMALKDLSPRQMVQITAAWLDPERERPRDKLGPLRPPSPAALMTDSTRYAPPAASPSQRIAS